MSRIAAFIRAARNLLWMQLGAAVIALALAIWALVAVRDLATERDRLASEVSELRRGLPDAGPTAPPTATGPAPSPLDTEIRPPAIMPVFFPVVTTPAITPEIPPVDIPPPDPATPAPTTPSQPGAADCSGPNADRQRCRPGRWSRRDPPVVTVPVTPAPEQPQRTEPPRPN